MGALRRCILATLVLWGCGRAGFDSRGRFDDGGEGAFDAMGAGRDAEVDATEEEDEDAGPGTESIVVSLCAPIGASVGSTITVSGWTPQPPDSLLLLHVVQEASMTSGDQTYLMQQSQLGDVGLFQLARTVSETVVGDTTEIELVVVPNFDVVSSSTRKVQACTFSEYSSLQVQSHQVLTGQPWNGERGGVVAIVVGGELIVDGAISAEGLGFRGGQTGVDSAATSVVSLDVANGSGDGGGKGEGIDLRSFDLSGRGNYGNGGGGGNARNAGGGGGGGGGTGGRGANEDANLGGDIVNGGLGGVGVGQLTRAVFGGGGGAGQANHGVAGAGGAGGGLVIIHAYGEVSGGGVLSARGIAGEDAGANENGFADGAGGGGGGGSIVLEAIGGSSGFTGSLISTGGAGGNVVDAADFAFGAGGGGGGGRIRAVDVPGTRILDGGSRGQFTGPIVTSTADATSGAPGISN